MRIFDYDSGVSIEHSIQRNAGGEQQTRSKLKRLQSYNRAVLVHERQRHLVPVDIGMTERFPRLSGAGRSVDAALSRLWLRVRSRLVPKIGLGRLSLD